MFLFVFNTCDKLTSFFPLKCLILFASFLSMAVAYKSFLSMNGRELINSGRSAGGSGGKVGSIQLLSPGKQVNSFKASSISKATRSSVSSFKPSRPTQQVLTQQLDTPILAPAPTVAEAPQLFAILVPAEEVASSHSVAAAPAPKLQLSAPSTAPAVQSQFHSVAPGATITAAIQTTHSIEVVDVPSSGSNSAPPEIHIPASSQPIELAFHSQSSPINVRQVHIPGEVSPPQHSQSEEEPEIIKTTVIKPIVQEIKEIVIPSRSITQVYICW